MHRVVLVRGSLVKCASSAIRAKDVDIFWGSPSVDAFQMDPDRDCCQDVCLPADGQSSRSVRRVVASPETRQGGSLHVEKNVEPNLLEGVQRFCVLLRASFRAFLRRLLMLFVVT